jgi:hypothetical protein
MDMKSKCPPMSNAKETDVARKGGYIVKKITSGCPKAPPCPTVRPKVAGVGSLV